jgi:hypothetical protein
VVKTSGGDMTSASTLFAHQQRWSLFRATGECRDARWTEQRAEGFETPWRCISVMPARRAQLAAAWATCTVLPRQLLQWFIRMLLTQGPQMRGMEEDRQY